MTSDPSKECSRVPSRVRMSSPNSPERDPSLWRRLGPSPEVDFLPCVFTDKTGPTTEEGCPLPYITISKGPEKFLIVAKERKGHNCEARYIVMAIIEWEFIPEAQAKDLHTNLKRLSQQFVVQSPRGCLTMESVKLKRGQRRICRFWLLIIVRENSLVKISLK